VPPALLNPILASMVLSMLATPFIILYSNRIVNRSSVPATGCMQSAADDHHRAQGHQPRST
jgi:hypothetical protein